MADSLRPSPDVVAERIDDEMVLVHLGTNAIYSLNPTAARAWELFDSGHPPSAIAERLLAEFDVGRDVLKEEVAALFASFADAGLLTRDTA